VHFAVFYFSEQMCAFGRTDGDKIHRHQRNSTILPWRMEYGIWRGICPDRGSLSWSSQITCQNL